MRTVHRYVNREPLKDRLWRYCAYRYLARMNVVYARERSYPMAVYAHEWVSTLIYVEGLYERVPLRSLIDFLDSIDGLDRPSMRVLDVGANLGNHTLFFARHFGSVVAFEPHPENFALLAFNTKCFPNIAIHRCALGDRARSASIQEDLLNSGAVAVASVECPAGLESITVQRLDDMQIDLTGLGLIKLDVEGMEYEVLCGARETLERWMPIVLLEQREADFAQPGGGCHATRWLKDLGYQICWLAEPNRKRGQVRRWLGEVTSILFQRDQVYRIITASEIPPGYYSLLVALPPQWAARIS